MPAGVTMIKQVLKAKAYLIGIGACLALLLSACGVQNAGGQPPLDEAFDAATVEAASGSPSSPTPGLPKKRLANVAPNPVWWATQTPSPFPNVNPSPAPTISAQPTVPVIGPKTPIPASGSNVAPSSAAARITIGDVIPHRVRPGERASFSASLFAPTSWARPEVYYPNSFAPVVLEAQVIEVYESTTWIWQVPLDVQEGVAQIILKTKRVNYIEDENGNWLEDFENPPTHFSESYLTTRSTFLIDPNGSIWPMNLELSSLVDSDMDGYSDTEDNCPFVSNPEQLDSDGDGIADVCGMIEKAMQGLANWLGLDSAENIYPAGPAEEVMWPTSCFTKRIAGCEEGAFPGYRFRIRAPVMELDYQYYALKEPPDAWHHMLELVGPVGGPRYYEPPIPTPTAVPTDGTYIYNPEQANFVSALPHRVRPGETITFRMKNVTGIQLWPIFPEVLYPAASEPLTDEESSLPKDDMPLNEFLKERGLMEFFDWVWIVPEDVPDGEARVTLQGRRGVIEYGAWQINREAGDIFSDHITFIVDSEAPREMPSVKLSTSEDSDQDGHLDIRDNCPFVSNSDQLDSNGDGVADACKMIENASRELARLLGLSSTEAVVHERPVEEVVWSNDCYEIHAYCTTGEYPGYKIYLYVPLAEREYLFYATKGFSPLYYGPADFELR